MIQMKKNETPWSVDIYIKNISKIRRILKRKNILTRPVYPPLNSQKFIKILEVFQFLIIIARLAYGFLQV